MKALSEGASCIAIVANTHALKFYSARGFVSAENVKTQIAEAERMTLDAAPGLVGCASVAARLLGW